LIKNYGKIKIKQGFGQTGGDGKMTMNTTQQKKALRESILEKERALTAEEKKIQDLQIYERLIHLEEYKASRTVFCFVGTEHEIDTKDFIMTSLSLGKCVAVPLCTGKGRMEARKIASMGDLSPGFYGLLEPGNQCPVIAPEDIDFAVVPCVSCDKKGHRLGRGGGYYDNYLPKIQGSCVLICRETLMVQVHTGGTPRRRCKENCDGAAGDFLRGIISIKNRLPLLKGAAGGFYAIL
jgi:5-formyltetrahydrofolate cyclo-ligase